MYYNGGYYKIYFIFTSKKYEIRNLIIKTIVCYSDSFCVLLPKTFKRIIRLQQKIIQDTV